MEGSVEVELRIAAGIELRLVIADKALTFYINGHEKVLIGGEPFMLDRF